MAKAPKAPKAPTSAFTFNGDCAIIVRDFAVFGHLTANNDARTALLRRITDVETFKAIRVTALAAWLVNQGYSEADARANVDKTLAHPNAIGTKAKRTADQQRDYVSVCGAWTYYLEINKVTTLTPRAKRAPKGKTSQTETPKASAGEAKAPPASLSAVIPVRGDMAVTLEQLANATALMQKVATVNGKGLKGDKGAAIRDFVAMVASNMARIQAMKD